MPFQRVAPDKASYLRCSSETAAPWPFLTEHFLNYFSGFLNFQFGRAGWFPIEYFAPWRGTRAVLA